MNDIEKQRIIPRTDGEFFRIISGIDAVQQSDLEGEDFYVFDDHVRWLHPPHGETVCNVLLQAPIQPEKIHKFESVEKKMTDTEIDVLTRAFDTLEKNCKLLLRKATPGVVNLSACYYLNNHSTLTWSGEKAYDEWVLFHPNLAKIVHRFGQRENFQRQLVSNAIKKYLAVQTRVTELLMKLRMKGFVFVSGLDNYPLSDIFSLFSLQTGKTPRNLPLHACMLSVNGIVPARIVPGQKLDSNKEDHRLYLLGSNPEQADCTAVSYWDDGEHMDVGNSLATPMVSLGVAMILRSLENLQFPLVPAMISSLSAKQQQSIMMELVSLREGCIKKILRDSSPIVPIVPVHRSNYTNDNDRRVLPTYNSIACLSLEVLRNNLQENHQEYSDLIDGLLHEVAKRHQFTIPPKIVS